MMDLVWWEIVVLIALALVPVWSMSWQVAALS